MAESAEPTPTLLPLEASRPREQSWKRYVYQLAANEVSSIARYFDQLIEIRAKERDSSLLFGAIDAPSKRAVLDVDSFPDLSHEREKRTVLLLNGTFNHNYDIQGLLLTLRPKLSRTSRVMVVVYNSYLSWLYRLANTFKLRSGPIGSTFLTHASLENVCKISGYEVLRSRPVGYFPWRLAGLGDLINRILPAVPIVRWLGVVSVITLRPKVPETTTRPTLSIVIPARNERGNIENALKRMPDLGTELEILFVEGHSKDGTWDEILRVREIYGSRFKIQAVQQTGKGKSDAVRLGFSKATGDILTILDADLTMPPELLGRFYEAYCQGHGDFVNGTRLVYPMEGEAMRFLNRLGNIFFAKALSFVLDTQLGDSLCGTKLLARHDYRRMIAWRGDFGDFDPFGDFELLFPAAVLGLGIVDIPIRYLARTYGSTQISRFRHGWMLLKMTSIGFFRIRMRGTPSHKS